MKVYNFNGKDSHLENFFYAYGPVAKAYKQFTQLEDCLANFVPGDAGHDDIFAYDYITDTASPPTYQAPYEVGAYEDGGNVGRVLPCPERVERPIDATLLGTLEFHIDPNELIDISFEVQGKQILAEVNGHKITCEHPGVPDEFHVGITACEGHNRFFDFRIED